MRTMRRGMCLVALVALFVVVPGAAFADTYPPNVEATEVVTDDAVPPQGGVLDESVDAPAGEDTDVLPVADLDPAGDALSSTGGDVIALLAMAVVMLIVGGGLAMLSGRRRRGTSTSTSA